jgi:hypothetical protein
MGMTQTGKPLNPSQKALDVRILKDHELDAVSGGQLQSAFSNVIKSIGQGLETMARKQ